MCYNSNKFIVDSKLCSGKREVVHIPGQIPNSDSDIVLLITDWSRVVKFREQPFNTTDEGKGVYDPEMRGD